jgi:rhamnosyl/mannosyltransferase
LKDIYQKCQVIPLGIDTARFDHVKAEEVRAFREKYGSRILACVGRFVPFKGFDYAIRAVAKVNATLLLAGEGPAESSLRQLAKDCGVADRVHFLGPVPNEKIPALLAASSVLLFPSTRRTESFGYSQLEAMAAGIPVINTAIRSGVPEISVDGLTGFTIPPMDHAALAAAVSVLLEDGALRARFGEAGIARVRDNYTLRQMTDRTKDLYETVLVPGQRSDVYAGLVNLGAPTVQTETVSQ